MLPKHTEERFLHLFAGHTDELAIATSNAKLTHEPLSAHVRRVAVEPLSISSLPS